MNQWKPAIQELDDHWKIFILLRFSMLFEHGQSLQQGYEPPSKKPCSGPGPSGSRDTSPGAGPLDCSKSENNVADLRIRQVGQRYCWCQTVTTSLQNHDSRVWWTFLSQIHSTRGSAGEECDAPHARASQSADSSKVLQAAVRTRNLIYNIE